MHCNKWFCSREHIEKEVVGDDKRCADMPDISSQDNDKIKPVTWHLKWGIKNNEAFDKPEMSF